MLDVAPQALASAFWQSHGLRTMTANALAAEGICSFDALRACHEQTLWRIPSIGKGGIADIRAMLLRRADEEAAIPLPLASYGDDALVMELLRRGYRIDRPNGSPTDA